MSDIAWAAGFFDGEGWSNKATIHQKSGWTGHYLRIGITQKDVRPLHRFHRAVGGWGSINGPRKLPPYTYQWQTTGRPAHRVMELLAPFLSEPKTEQWERVLASIEESRGSTQEALPLAS